MSDASRSRLHRATFTVLRGLFAPIAWTAGAIPIILAAPPAGWFLMWAWPLTPASWLLGSLVKVSVLFGAYLLYGCTLLIVIIVLSRLLPMGYQEGREGHESSRSVFFVIRNVWMLVARVIFLTFVRATPLMSAYLRGLGAEVGAKTLVNTVQVWDAPLLRIGKGAVIGGSSVIMGHYGDEDDLLLAPVHIGHGAVVGERAVVFPDTEIGDGAILGANSVLLPGSRIPPGERWMGVPAQPMARDEPSDA